MKGPRKPESWAMFNIYVVIRVTPLPRPPYIASILFTCVKFTCVHRKRKNYATVEIHFYTYQVRKFNATLFF